MSDYFTKNFVDLRHIGLAPNRIAKLRLYHRKSAFHIRPLVIVLEKGILVEREVMKHLLEDAADATSGVALEQKIWETTIRQHYLKIVLAGVCLVSRYFTDGEVATSVLDQFRKLRSVASVLFKDFNRRYHIGFDAANQVCLDPLPLGTRRAMLFVEPSVKAASAETGGVHGEVLLDGSQWQTARYNEVLQNGFECGLFQTAKDAVVVWKLANITFLAGISEVGHKPPSRESGINFIGGAEHQVGKCDARATHLLRRFGYGLAKVVKQDLEMCLLVGLRLVVVGPVLRVSLADGFGNGDGFRYGGCAVRVLFTLNDIFNGENVFALHASGFVVGASAGGAVGVEEDRILAVS